ncbi:MAG: ferritin-like domain-containing protein [Nocardioidaceae bacterium]
MSEHQWILIGFETLGQAINMQAESVLTMSILAGTMRGVGGAAIKQDLRSFVLAELEDTYRLVEKLSALGGTPTMTATDVSVSDDGDKALSALLDHEVKAVAALHAVIPHSGQEPRSEALEHMLEHVIMRKQQQIDYLWHAAEREEPLA